MTRLFSWLSKLLVLSGLALQAQAQIVIEVPGRADLPIAVPVPQAAGPQSTEMAAALWSTLKRDLKMTGYFHLIDPDAYLDRYGGVEPGSFKWDDWRLLSPSILVKTRVLAAGNTACDPRGEAVCFDLFIYHASTGDLLLKERLRTSSPASRYLAHEAADLVVQTITGRPGPFSQRLVAVTARSGNKEIALLDLDGKGVTPLTRNGSINLSPDISPTGDRLVWTSFRRGNPDVFSKNLKTGRVSVVSNNLGVNVSPSWSPDQRWVTLARTDGADSDIVVVNATSGKLVHRITRGGGIDVSPCFSPDGTKIAFASERSGGSQVYVSNADGTQPHRVTFQGDFNGDPVFHPDGKQLAFVGRERGGFDIYVVDTDGRNLRRITQDMRDNEDPAWSPDGMYLAFSSTRTGRSEIWVSTADGRHQVPVTGSGGWTQPSWLGGP
jgi:TolB protein